MIEKQPRVIWRDGATEWSDDYIWLMPKDNLFIAHRAQGITIHNENRSKFYWMPGYDMPEFEILPCPFCGASCSVNMTGLLDLHRVIRCESCSYRSATYESKQEAITEHNQVVRKVRE